MKCPKCRQAMQSGQDGKRAVWACLLCQTSVPKTAERPTQMKIPGLDPGRQEVYIQEAEKKLVRRIKRELEQAGYRVALVGQGIALLGGNDEGTPDIYATPLGQNNWKGLEVKLPGYSPNDVRPVQQVLCDNGEIAIITSTAEALRVLQED